MNMYQPAPDPQSALECEPAYQLSVREPRKLSRQDAIICVPPDQQWNSLVVLRLLQNCLPFKSFQLGAKGVLC